MARLGESLNGTRSEPGLDNNIVGDSGVPLQDHLLPNHGDETQRTNLVMNVGKEPVEQGLQDSHVVGLQIRVEDGVVGSVLITTSVEVGRVRRDTGQKILKQSINELLDLGVVELESTARGLGAVVLVGALVIGDSEAGVSLLNTNVAGHVNLHDDLNTTVDTILIDALDVCGRVGQAGSIGTLLCQKWQGRDLQRPRLGLSNVQVQYIQLVHGQAINRSLDIINGEPMATNIEQNTTVGELGLILNGDGADLGVPRGTGRVLEEELGEGLKSAQHTGRGHGGDGGLASLGNLQGVRLVDGAGDGLEGVGVVLAGLGDGELGDALASTGAGLKLGVWLAKHPWDESILEDGAKGARDTGLDNLLAVEPVAFRGLIVGGIGNL